MAWVFSIIHFPATGTRLVPKNETQTIPVSGLDSYDIEKKSAQKLPNS
jgi:hypothetical protein